MSRCQQQWFQLQDTLRSIICQYSYPIDFYHLALTCRACFQACSEPSIWKNHLLEQFGSMCTGMTRQDLDELENGILLHHYPSLMRIFIKLGTIRDKSYLVDTTMKKTWGLHDYVKFAVHSNVGCVAAEGFCSQLVAGFYYEEYDPVPDFYRRLVNGIPISIHALYMQEEYSSTIAVQMVKSIDVFIYMIKLRGDNCIDIASHLEYLKIFTRASQQQEIALKYMIGLFWTEAVDEPTRKYTIQQHLKECDVHDAQVMDCSLHSRDDTEQVVRRALAGIELFDWKKFMNNLPAFKPHKKKPCLCM